MRRGTRGKEKERRMDIRIRRGTVTAPSGVPVSQKDTEQLKGRSQALVMPPYVCGWACFVSKIVINY